MRDVKVSYRVNADGKQIKKYLVTGGAGFIGSNIVESLIRDGHEVVVLDNFHTGSFDNLKNISEKLTVMKGNINNSVEEIDGVFHLGIPSSTPMYKQNKYLMGQTINEFIYLLNTYPDTKIVFSFSSSIYNGITPPHREYASALVTDFYTETRIAMERLASLYNTLYGNKVVALRLFSVYGPHEQAKGMYANMITQMLWKMIRNERPVIYGDGTQTRDFIRVEDVVNAFRTVMDSIIQSGRFNVGTGVAHSFNDVASTLNKELGKNIEPVYVENPLKNYVHDTLADTEKTFKWFGFKAKISFNEGIRKTIDEHMGTK
jgi:UDP-glucose 4-epimerase